MGAFTADQAQLLASQLHHRLRGHAYASICMLCWLHSRSAGSYEGPISLTRFQQAIIKHTPHHNHHKPAQHAHSVHWRKRLTRMLLHRHPLGSHHLPHHPRILPQILPQRVPLSLHPCQCAAPQPHPLPACSQGGSALPHVTPCMPHFHHHCCHISC